MAGRYAAIAAARAAVPGLLGDEAEAARGIRAVIDDMRDRHGEDGVAALVESLSYPYVLHAVGMIDAATATSALRVFTLPDPDRPPWSSHPELLRALHTALDAYTRATLEAEDEALRGDPS